MKKQKLVVLLTAAIVSVTLLGCGKTEKKTADSGKKTVTIEIYDAAANYQGMQTGWFGKVLKDKLDIELNLIAPNVAGDPNSLYQTRCAAGNLGDVVILDNAQFQDCVKAGLIADIGSDISSYKNLMKYDPQIKQYNNMLGEKKGSIFGLPCEMNSNGPTVYVEDTVYSCPRIPWDFYTELGRPKMKTLDDLLTVLGKIQAAHPTGIDGEKSFALSLWSDWDNPNTNCGIEVVNQITKWYGQEVNGSVLISNNGKITPVTDTNGAYYKMLHFMYEANKKGLLDPDSGTQDWNTVVNKMKSKRVYLLWYNWQRNFWNTPERANKDSAFICAPVDDMNIYQTSDTYYGDGRVWGIGSRVSKEKKKRILEFLDWYASPEGLQYQHDGLEGIIYTVQDNGKIKMTTDGYAKNTKDIQIPENLGGGTFRDGDNQINQWIASSLETNPKTGECYDVNYISATRKANETTMTKEWSDFYHAPNEVTYYENNGQLKIVPSVNLLYKTDSTDMAMIRSQCGETVCDTSWKMIYAKDENEFNQMWKSMMTDLQGLGWDQLVKFDTQKYQAVVDARAAAQK